MSRRMLRVNTLLRQEISRVLASEVNDPRVSSLVSVTRVDTSSDLGTARVFVSVLGTDADKKEALNALRSAAGYIRKSIRRQVSLRAVPAVEFSLDRSLEEGEAVLKLINEVAPAHDPDLAQ